MSRFTKVALALVGAVVGQDFNYEKKGADWPEANWNNNNCKAKGQSPIDLHMRDEEQDKPMPARFDQFNLIAIDPVKRRIEWKDNRFSFVNFDKNKEGMAINSWGAYTSGTVNLFEAANMRIRSPSEHTFNKKQMDVELQFQMDKSYNRDGDKYKGGMYSVIFDRKHKDEWNRVRPWMRENIDAFWDSMLLEKNDNPESPVIQLNGLMQLLDNDNRWAYNGTRTYPPCEGPVLWTIPMIVLPIKEEHYSQIQKQLQRSNDKGVKEFGNAREVQESDEENKFTIIYHEPTFMLMQGVGFFMILAIVFLVLCMVYLICCLVFFCKSRKLQKITTNQLQMTTMSDVGGGKAGLA